MAYGRVRPEATINYLTKVNAYLQDEVLGSASAAGARYLRGKIKRATPVRDANKDQGNLIGTPTGRLKRSVRVTSLGGSITNSLGQRVSIRSRRALVYFKYGRGGGNHAHLVTGSYPNNQQWGHRIYVRGVPKKTEPLYTKAKPFAREVVERENEKVQDIIAAKENELTEQFTAIASGQTEPTTRYKKLAAIEGDVIRVELRKQGRRIAELQARRRVRN